MKNYFFDEDLLCEIEEIIDITKSNSKIKKVPIIFDGRQYTIKIPKKLAQSVGIDKNDSFEFSTDASFVEGEKVTRLEGKLVKEK